MISRGGIDGSVVGEPERKSDDSLGMIRPPG